MIAIDTNLLLYSFHPRAPQHAAARTALERAQAHGAGWGVAAAAVTEFWSVATRLEGGTQMAAPAQAAAYLAALHRAGAEFWQGQRDFAVRLLAVATRMNIRGRRVYDLQIALTARDNGASEIWSHDRGFATLDGLPLVDPLR